MKLKSIRINGFKSFADKIDLELKSNITAIVGPNGSGKSNIVDAVRWVLGEQSIKSLRGSKEMIDVIFAGSASRNPLKRAEVALEFDNQSHFLNTDIEQVEIKRVLYYTGDNEYYINNAKVRLKDITNLFLDSGIGNESLNIISQGSIEKIVTAKPEDRRIIIESASKVLKYKNRKIESLRKLEKAKDNLEKVDLVIEELENNLEPLEKQSKEAQKYLQIAKEYQELDACLTTYDIKMYNDQLKELQKEQEQITTEKLKLESANTKEGSSLEILKTKNLAIEGELANKNEKYQSIIEQLAKIESEKTILLERQKYSVDQTKVNEEYLQLKEKEEQLKKESALQKYAVENLEKKVNELKKQIETIDEKLIVEENKKNNLEIVFQNKIRNLVTLENQISLLKNNIEEDRRVPTAVKNVLHNPRLKGINETIGNLIKVDKQYEIAIEVALGNALNYVVVDNAESAKEAINYLKENHLGRVTFFPLNVIKSRLLPSSILNSLTKMAGFIGIASNLMTYDKIYQNIIENQLGNVVIAKDINSMNQIAKFLEFKFRVVSLDGEITHAGGSISGGSLKTTNNTLNDKILLEKKEQELKANLYEKDKINQESLELKELISSLNSNRQTYENDYFVNERELKFQIAKSTEIQNNLEKISLTMQRVATFKSGNFEQELGKFLEKEQKLATEKELLKNEITNLKEEKRDLMSKMEEEEFAYRQKNSAVHSLVTKLNQLEIDKNKIDIRMDYLLNHLNETYHITYEKAKVEYVLDMDVDITRENVTRLKKELEQYNMVNLGSIDEYERIKNRYDFLNSQKNDLTVSITELEEIIGEMDEKMIERLTTTFDQIAKEFSKVFKQLFKGGNGLLKLTNPSNILETGIDIIAEPPGKKLNNIALLSGGEKTLTAIALLFAILNVFPVPFCILDEVEAALDEANVDTFGQFLQAQKEKSEYLLITHKKRTMEYADTLYGITMQEQGVSKIVSVKLEN